ncbi:hypothetical protein LAZ67_18002059 [Cordylochernes scorpioides]|uniref:Integrase catalytic domain-containing protein n=1 Tax=Cordylochernes scorpioides TaxID=51811 RepID=A0ABY6LG92_9ARAC|nr:hypothetical protein LAZ67_18002059 [Cordylochernes scorpioides]
MKQAGCNLREASDQRSSKVQKSVWSARVGNLNSNLETWKARGNVAPKSDTPLDTYHIDHLGPLASTRKDYNYLLVITDGFTKFTWIYSTKTTRTSEVIQKLECQQQILGNPRQINTDQGTAFTYNDFREYIKDESIEHCYITTGVQQGYGQVERINRTIVSVLTKLSIDNPQEWYKYVGKLQKKTLNSTHQRSIRMSPFELLVRIQEESRKTFYKKAFVYKEGDLVVIQKSQFATKSELHPKYNGPYKCLAEIPFLTDLIESRLIKYELGQLKCVLPPGGSTLVHRPVAPQRSGAQVGIQCGPECQDQHLAFISEGCSPIRHLGTRPIAVSSAKGQVGVLTFAAGVQSWGPMVSGIKDFNIKNEASWMSPKRGLRPKKQQGLGECLVCKSGKDDLPDQKQAFQTDPNKYPIKWSKNTQTLASLDS